MAKNPTLTTSSGAPVSDNQNCITAGPRGPVLMQDFHLLEKLAHQNRERIPERTVHAKGSAAYGTLSITKDISKYTTAKALQPGKKTDAFLRFYEFARGTSWEPDEKQVCWAAGLWVMTYNAPPPRRRVTWLTAPPVDASGASGPPGAGPG